jgi:hypothetical protein
MKTKQIILSIALLGLISQTVSAQKVGDWFKKDAVLIPFHVKTSPNTTREEVLSFLHNEYFPVYETAFPGRFSFHIEGIAGDRKDQHAQLWVFASDAVRDSYHPEPGIEPSEKYWKYKKELNKKISQNKMVELFRGYDLSINTDWKIVSKTDDRPSLTDLRGLEMDMHYLPLEYDGDAAVVQGALEKILKNTEHPNSQFFIMYGERDVRKGAYAILELHTPGNSHQSAFESLDLPLEKGLFSSYRIW